MSLIQKTEAMTVRFPDADEITTGKDARAKKTDGSSRAYLKRFPPIAGSY
jgi:hypothetical protein